MSDTNTTKIQQLIDQQAQKQVDQEASELLDLVIGYLADRPICGHQFGALHYQKLHGGVINKYQVDPGHSIAKPFKEALLTFLSDWKKIRFETIQSSMTNDLLQKVNLLTPQA
jgi:hypothetical protein